MNYFGMMPFDDVGISKNYTQSTWEISLNQKEAGGKTIELLMPKNCNLSLNRDFSAEVKIRKQAEAYELLINALESEKYCTDLFPKHRISDYYIEYSDYILLRKSLKLRRVNSFGLVQISIFPAGTLLNRQLNGNLKLIELKGMFDFPLFKLFTNSLGINEDQIPDYIQKKLLFIKGESFYNTNTYHKAQVNKLREDFIPHNMAYIDQFDSELFPKSSIPSMIDSFPVIETASENMLQMQPKRFPDDIFIFQDRYAICDTPVCKFTLPSGKSIFVPMVYMQEKSTGMKILNCQPFSFPTVPFNGDKISQELNAKIFLTPSIEYANSLTSFFEENNTTELIASSWVYEIKSLDLSYFKNRDLFYLLLEIEGQSIHKGIKNAIHLMQNLDSSTRLKIIVVNKSSLSQAQAITWKEFIEFCNKHYNIKLPVDTKDKIGIVENALLKSGKDIKDRPIIVEGLTKGGKIIVIGGGAKTGKSFATYSLALAISYGQEIWGLKTKKTKTLYFDTEMDDDDYKDRGFADKQHEGFKVFLASDLQLPRAKADDMASLIFILESIKNYALKKGFEVVVIDCMYRLLNENSPTEVKVFVNKLKEMKRDGILIIVVHHFNKSDIDFTDPFKNLAGHSNFYRAVDGGILLIPDKDQDELDDGSPKVITMKFVARSFKQIPDKELVFDNGKHILVSECEDKIQQQGLSTQKAPSQISKLKIFIKENLPDNPDEAIPTKDLAELMGNNKDVEGSTSNIQKRKLAEWFDAGYLKRIGLKPYKYYQGDNL
jgi:archaellum biogenesis ATPase FlaH